MLGVRVLQLDLDMVITGDITAFATRPEPFIVWDCEAIGRIGHALNPSLLLMDTGRYTYVWERYLEHGDELVKEANRAGCAATDQAVITYLFTRDNGNARMYRRDCNVPVWTAADGVINFRNGLRQGTLSLPANTRIVSFHGPHDPARYEHLDWVREYWHDVAQTGLDSNVSDLTPMEVSHA